MLAGLGMDEVRFALMTFWRVINRGILSSYVHCAAEHSYTHADTHGLGLNYSFFIRAVKPVDKMEMRSAFIFFSPSGCDMIH